MRVRCLVLARSVVLLTLFRSLRNSGSLSFHVVPSGFLAHAPRLPPRVLHTGAAINVRARRTCVYSTRLYTHTSRARADRQLSRRITARAVFPRLDRVGTQRMPRAIWPALRTRRAVLRRPGNKHV